MEYFGFFSDQERYEAEQELNAWYDEQEEHYIMMMHDGTLLAPPQQYTDIPTYLQWLKNGLSNVPSHSIRFKFE